ncbi:MAG: hypothetical protein J6386_06130 [Candidatus Synoicihabitans palmerolidicus]|nr:hypothetical protein [Candidatus Synoicihabitans palmerolidicus]
MRNRRKQTAGLSVELFLTWGVMRALDADEFGRAVLHARADQTESLPRSTWFDAFQSTRRLEILTEVATKSYRELGDRDWLAEYDELADHLIWAVDGHQIAHATYSACDGKGRSVASGMSYGLCFH